MTKIFLYNFTNELQQPNKVGRLLEQVIKFLFFLPGFFSFFFLSFFFFIFYICK